MKRFLRACSQSDLPRDLPIRARDLPQTPLRIVGKAVRASDAEIAANPRARQRDAARRRTQQCST